MKVLLTETIERTGIVGEVIEVSNGFARNFLLPKGLAVQPTDGNIKRLEAARIAYEAKQKQVREQKERVTRADRRHEAQADQDGEKEGREPE